MMKKTISLLSQQTNLYCVISSVFSSGIIHYLDKQCHKQHTQALEVLVFIMLTNLYFIEIYLEKKSLLSIRRIVPKVVLI